MDPFEMLILPGIGRTSKMLDDLHAKRLKANGYDLTKEQWMLLKMLSQKNGLSQNEIACIRNRDKTTMTRLINTLERKSLITRIPSKKDKRKNQLFLTPKGLKMVKDTEPIWIEIVSELKRGIAPSEALQLLEILEKLQHNIKTTLLPVQQTIRI